MGRGRQGSGVEVLRTSLRVRFTVDGVRHKVTLHDMKPTPANIKAAERMMAQVRHEIELGVFDWERHFPRSKPSGSSGRGRTFADYAEVYLKTASVGASTLRVYKIAANHWKAILGTQDIGAITAMRVREAIAEVSTGRDGQTTNLYVTVLRAIFECAVEDEVIAVNPTSKVKPVKVQLPPPDPLDYDEMRLVLAHMDSHYPEPVAAFYQFAFAVGCRPSEQIAIRWSKVDWVHRTVTIDAGFVRGLAKGTKTHKAREVDLNDMAVGALMRMKPYSFMKGVDHQVFVNPQGGPWYDSEWLRTHYWHPAIRAVGLRARDAYQTRHTFATLLLMGGVNVAYISTQLGHASITTTLKHYAKWVSKADKGAQAGEANRVFTSRIGQQLATGS